MRGNNIKRFMVDLETLATSERSLVVQIGACEFDLKTGTILSSLDLSIDLDSYSLLNKSDVDIDPNTVKFWLNQSKSAKDKVFRYDTDIWNVHIAFGKLFQYIENADEIWCHTSFDFKILDYYHKMLQIRVPFSHWIGRDLRTAVAMAKYDYKSHPFKGEKHNAIDDCYFQVSYLRECYKRLGLIGK